MHLYYKRYKALKQSVSRSHILLTKYVQTKGQKRGYHLSKHGARHGECQGAGVPESRGSRAWTTALSFSHRVKFI